MTESVCYNFSMKWGIFLKKNFSSLRKEYPLFSYDGYSIRREEGGIVLRFDFSVPGLCEFRPETVIKTDNLKILNHFDSVLAQKIAFSLGMAEAVSYWKCVCAPVISIPCGFLTDEDLLWWKKLWFNGLGEFFYKNNIETTEDNFVSIKVRELVADMPALEKKQSFLSSALNLIPVGGGKDSCVSLNLLAEMKEKNICFTLNDQPAREETAAAAGYGPEKILRTYRTVDSELLRLNAEGYLNGHTPFSSVLAFLSYYCAYLTGAENIVLSNEASANEASVAGTDINHQYSKSYAFEADFTAYTSRNFLDEIHYFSLLRPFNELQIAKKFASLQNCHKVFRSCNAGSKANIWCGSCAKCLFVFLILSPFLSEEYLTEIFGKNMLGDDSLLPELQALAGVSENKPFECVGTVEEVRCAIRMTLEKYEARGRELPVLLRAFDKDIYDGSPQELLAAFNREHGVPAKFERYVTEMHNAVRGTD